VFFAEDFGFERYVEWLLDVPMYFVYRDGAYIDLAGQSFRAFMAGGIAGAGPATIGDFADHMTTAFTDVRVKRFLEMRGADAGSPAMMLAQSALWVGLLYDDAALAAAESLVREQPWDAYRTVRAEVPQFALGAAWAGGSLRDLADRVVAIARDGLRARARLDAAGRDESVHLAPLEDIAAGAPTQAERWLERLANDWGGDVSRVFAESAV
jgi:glutamate--cysteine ligase